LKSVAVIRKKIIFAVRI